MVSRYFITFGLILWSLAGSGFAAETFTLTTGDTLVGELLVSSASDTGVQIKVGDGKYEKVSWSSFSQDDLKRLLQNQKLTGFVEPFIEITQEDRIKKTEVQITPPPRLERPAPQNLFGAMFSSGLGLFVIFLIYAGNIYAAYEIAVFRARPPILVCGVAAVAPFIGPAIFLALPTQLRHEEEPAVSAEAAAAAVAADGTPAEGEINPMLAEGVAHPTGLSLHKEPESAKSTLPETQVFSRGQFTFNRRFFETKFVNFFSMVKRDADKDMVLVFKTTKGEFTGQRISRIASNDLHLQVQRGAATEEIQVHFNEVQEVRLKHKDAH